MNPFERHGIKHLSASSLALYRNEPALWVLKYLYSVRDEAGAAAWRGSAVEAGLNLFFLRGASEEECVNAAMLDFEARALGDLSDDIVKERDCIPALVRTAIGATRGWGQPLASQIKVEHWIEGVEVPLLGYVDYSFPEFDFDLKTTLRMPSEPRPDHAVQVVSYGLARNKPQRLLYVTPKKWQTFDTFDTDAALYTLRRSARALRAMLDRCPTKQAAADIFTPNFDSFYWTPATKSAALGVFA